MASLGKELIAAPKRWQYPDEPLQRFWRAAGFFVVLFVVYQILQSVFATLIFHVFSGGQISNLADINSPSYHQFIKAFLIALFPASVPVIALAFYVARFGMPNQAGRLPLRVPKLGWLGWPALIFGFLVLCFLMYQAVFLVLGIDPASYAPSSDGLSDHSSAAGLVEKAMVELAQDPKLFTLVVLSAVVGAPVVEELLFRGALFAAIAQTRLGRVGAVLITSAMFGLAHALTDGWPVVAVLMAMGVVLGLLLLRFGSLWVTIACHAAWNGVQSLALFGVGTHS